MCFCITHLELSLEEELLRTLGAVVYLVLLSVDGKDVLLQLISLNKHWGEKDRRETAVKRLAETLYPRVYSELAVKIADSIKN